MNSYLEKRDLKLLVPIPYNEIEMQIRSCYNMSSSYTGWLKKLLTQLWTFIFGNEYFKQNIDVLYSREKLISFHENFISSKSVE